MNRKKIYVNGRFLNQNMTGVQRFAKEICLALISQGYNLVLLTPFETNKKNYLPNCETMVVGKYSGLYWEMIELPLYLKKIGSPILINLCNRAPLFYENNILVLHDITFIRHPKSFSKSFLIVYKYLIPRLLKNAKKILTVSDFSRKELSEYYKIDFKSIGIIYNAVSNNFYPLKEKSQETDKYLLAVSSDVYNKNFERLILAFNKMNNPNNIKLKVAGRKGSIAEKYINTSSNIDFIGRVSDEELVRLYQNAIAFVFPSIYEGFGIPPLEAQACGCPVLSSDFTAMPEILANSAYYFNPLDLDDIAEKIALIIEDKELRNSLILRGHSNVKRFSWESSAERLFAIIESEINIEEGK